MPDDAFITFMGPFHTSSDNNPNTSEPLKYLTNGTKKIQYKDALVSVTHWLTTI